MSLEDEFGDKKHAGEKIVIFELSSHYVRFCEYWKNSGNLYIIHCNEGMK
jgi:hypothetical protein